MWHLVSGDVLFEAMCFQTLVPALCVLASVNLCFGTFGLGPCGTVLRLGEPEYIESLRATLECEFGPLPFKTPNKSLIAKKGTHVIVPALHGPETKQ